MSFSIQERVARLFAGNRFQGSAWLVTPTLAISARHCVYAASLLEKDLTLSFPRGPTGLTVTVVDENPELDTVLLELASPGLEGRVIHLARRPLLRLHAAVTIAGHSGQSQQQMAGAATNRGQVIAIDQPLPNGGQSVYATLSGWSSGAADHEQLKGLSGGVVWDEADTEGREVFVTGLMLRNPVWNNIFALPIAALLDWNSALSDAYERSPHRAAGALCIYQDATGGIQWSASLRPRESGIFWDGTNPITAINCRSSRADLGDELFWALVRLAFHCDVDCSVREHTEWAAAFNRLSGQPPYPVKECDGLHRIPTPVELFAPCEGHAAADLAQTIHTALDAWMLKSLDSTLRQILTGTRPGYLDYEIQPALRFKMATLWTEWEKTLRGNSVLLRSVLVRLATHIENAQPQAEALSLVGPKADMRTFWEPTLFALALAAADIDLCFAGGTCGNVQVFGGQVEGHACGCSKIGGRAIHMQLRESVIWGVALVLLPMMREPYLGAFKRFTTMDASSGMPRIGDRGPPPVIITGDGDFHSALEHSAGKVTEHVKHLRDELAKVIAHHFDQPRAEQWKDRLKF